MILDGTFNECNLSGDNERKRVIMSYMWAPKTGWAEGIAKPIPIAGSFLLMPLVGDSAHVHVMSTKVRDKHHLSWPLGQLRERKKRERERNIILLCK